MAGRGQGRPLGGPAPGRPTASRTTAAPRRRLPVRGTLSAQRGRSSAASRAAAASGRGPLPRTRGRRGPRSADGRPSRTRCSRPRRAPGRRARPRRCAPWPARSCACRRRCGRACGRRGRRSCPARRRSRSRRPPRRSRRPPACPGEANMSWPAWTWSERDAPKAFSAVPKSIGPTIGRNGPAASRRSLRCVRAAQSATRSSARPALSWIATFAEVVSAGSAAVADPATTRVAARTAPTVRARFFDRLLRTFGFPFGLSARVDAAAPAPGPLGTVREAGYGTALGAWVSAPAPAFSRSISGRASGSTP